MLGMSVDLYRRVAPALTVYSGRRGIDLAVAPREALAALPGVNVEELDTALNEVDEDDDSGDRIQRLGTLVDGRRLLSSSNRRAFSITAVARSSDGAVFVREAVIRLIRRRDRPHDIVHWKRGRLDAVGGEAQLQ